MRAFRVIPAGCPKCDSRSMHYDWSCRANLFEVPLAIIFALVPLPIGDIHFLCDRCGERFTSTSARNPIKLSSGVSLSPGKSYRFNLSGGNQSIMKLTERSGEWLKGTYSGREVVVKIESIESATEDRGR